MNNWLPGDSDGARRRMEISAADSEVLSQNKWEREFQVLDGIVCVNVGATRVGGSYL